MYGDGGMEGDGDWIPVFTGMTADESGDSRFHGNDGGGELGFLLAPS